MPSSFAPTTVTLVTHDSFALSEDLLTEFTARSGITVKVVAGGDAGEVVNKAALTAGNPEGDVLFGVDNTLLSRAVTAGVFDPYVSPAAADVAPELRASTDDVVTPVDYGDVCVNVDDAWFAAKGLTPPATLADLALPAYRDLLVVENAATSSPGLAFLLATIARYGEDGYLDYWTCAARERREGRQRLDRGLRGTVLRRRHGHPAAGGVLRVLARRPRSSTPRTRSPRRRPPR